jgi:antitoxin MazE
MKTNIINIGNSRGIILPSTILRKLHISSKSEVDIFTDNDAIVIKPRPRMGWEKQFEAAIKTNPPEGDMFEGVENEFDGEDWEW